MADEYWDVTCAECGWNDFYMQYPPIKRCPECGCPVLMVERKCD